MSLAHLFSGKDTVKTQRSNLQSSVLDLVFFMRMQERRQVLP